MRFTKCFVPLTLHKTMYHIFDNRGEKEVIKDNEKIDSPMYTEKIIDSKGNISIPLKFKLHQKVYCPRIVLEKRKLIDIREYYIVRINVTVNSNFTSISYHASPYKENTRGKLFYEGNQLFDSYEKALEYAKEQGCNVEDMKKGIAK